jgi:hypothetical protein
MLNPIGDRFSLSLGPQGAQLALRSGLWRPRYRLLGSLAWSAQASDAQRGDVLDELLMRHATAGGALTVLVDDLWVPSTSVQPPVNASTLADLKAAVAMRLRTVTDAATGWETASEPRVAGRFVASALRSVLLDQLREQSQRYGLHLVSVQPLFAAVWNHWHAALAPGQWLGICRAGALTLCIAPNHQVEQIRRLEFVPANAQEPHWPGDAVQREALRLGVPAPSAVALCGAVPLAWRQAAPVTAGPQSGPETAYLGAVGDALGLWGVQI